MNNKLINHLKQLLKKNNYLDLNSFLDVILYNKQFGFYNSIKLFISIITSVLLFANVSLSNPIAAYACA